jgi:hypothetical protein
MSQRRWGQRYERTAAAILAGALLLLLVVFAVAELASGGILEAVWSMALAGVMAWCLVRLRGRATGRT